jgi:hypothetical protein
MPHHRPNSVSWNLEVTRVEHFQESLIGVALVVGGGLLMAALRPLTGDWSLLALVVSAAGAAFAITVWVRGCRMSAAVVGDRLVIRGFWATRSVDARAVTEVEVVSESAGSLAHVRVHVDGVSEPIRVPSWPSECAEELVEVLRGAGAETQLSWSAPAVPGATGGADGLGGTWRDEVYRSEYSLWRAPFWVLGVAALAGWFQVSSLWWFAPMAVAVVALTALRRRAHRIGVVVRPGELTVLNMWTTHRVPLDVPVRLVAVAGVGNLLLAVESDERSVVVEGVPWSDPGSFAERLRAAGASVSVDVDPDADPPSSEMTVPSYWRRLTTVH